MTGLTPGTRGQRFESLLPLVPTAPLTVGTDRGRPVADAAPENEKGRLGFPRAAS